MLQLIWRNLWQKKIRTLVTVLGLAVATGTLFSMLAFQRGYKRGLERELYQLGAHVLVVPKGCPYDAASLALHGANWPCYLKEAYLSQVAQTPGVAVAAPVLMAASYGPRREIVVGITGAYRELRPTWKIRGAFPETGGEVLLGAEAARNLMGQVGQTVHLQLLKREMRVSGILEPLSGPDDDFIFMQLAPAQQALKQEGHLTHVLVKLSSPARLEQTIEALRGCDAGMQMNIVPLAHLFETIRKVSAAAQYLLTALAAIAFLVSGTALANTMFMTVLERTREIGVLRAIGASASQVFGLFLAESALVGAVGATLGLTGAFACSRLIEEWVRGKIAYAPEASLIGVDPFAAAFCMMFAVVIAVLAGLAPAARATQLDPVVAFRAQAAY
jgi:putative ABC transport system permease protein